MKLRTLAPGGDYLQKSGASWANCLAATPVTGISLADTEYMYIGKRLAGGVFYLWQSFVRFNTSVIPDSHKIVSAKLRVFVHTDGSATDVTVRAKILDATYGTVDSGDWGAAGSYAVTASTSLVATGLDGIKYLDLEFSSPDALATILTINTVYDLRLEITNQTTAPTGDEYLKCYGPSSATYRPYLYVETACRREQIIAGLVTTLDTIDEFSGYSTTPKTVSRVAQPILTLNDASKYPMIFVLAQIDTHEHLPSNADDCDWRVVLVGAVYDNNREKLGTRLSELADDIERCLALTANERLGLAGNTIDFALVESVETAEDCVIGNNRAYCLITVGIKYPKYLDET